MNDTTFLEEEKKALALTVRKTIYDIVHESAGCHFRELERRSKIPNGSLKYHLSYLVRHGLLKEEKVGKLLRYFPSSLGTENKKLLGFLRQESIRKIVLYILLHQNCSQEMIVAFVGLSPSTASWHLKKLEEAKLVRARKSGRKTLYTLLVPEEDIMKLLITHQESFFDSLVDRVVQMWS